MNDSATNFSVERIAELRKNLNFSDIPEIKDFSSGYLRLETDKKALINAHNMLPSNQVLLQHHKHPQN
jgi:hypothetical protein